MKVHATASVSKTLLKVVNILDIESFFADQAIVLRAIKYYEETVCFALTGTKENLRVAMRKIRSGDSLSDSSIKLKQEELIQSQSEKETEKIISSYLNYCSDNNIEPHPELDASLQNK
jgi:hypothetical protein